MTDKPKTVNVPVSWLKNLFANANLTQKTIVEYSVDSFQASSQISMLLGFVLSAGLLLDQDDD